MLFVILRIWIVCLEPKFISLLLWFFIICFVDVVVVVVVFFNGLKCNMENKFVEQQSYV